MATESSAIFNFFSQLSKDVAINGDVTDLASNRGIFNSKGMGSVDYNTLLNQGFYSAYATGSTNGPGDPRRIIVLGDSVNDDNPIQIAVTNQPISSKSLHLDIRGLHPTNGWSDWTRFISEHDVATASVAGIMQPGDGLKSEDNGIVSVDETVVRTSGNQTIGGNKVFSSPILVSTNGVCRYTLQNKDLPVKRSDPVAQNIYTRLDFFNSGGLNNIKNRMGTVQLTKNVSGSCNIYLACNNPYNDDAEQSAQLGCGWRKGADDVPFAYAYCPTPAADSNNNYIATTEWVRNYTPPSSNKLTTARSIDGINFNGEENVVHYTTCSTAAETVDKVVTLDNFVLTTGAKLYIRFTVTNTAASPTLNVNSTGAKPIQYRNAAISAGYLAANRTYCFIYDGSSYELVGDINIDTNTKVTQTVTTTNNEYPILLSNDANKTATSTTTSRFATNVKVNPSTDTIVAKGFNGDPGVSTYINSAKSGGSLIENPNANAGTYMPFIRYKSTNGVFVLAGYQNGIKLVYLNDETIDSNTNIVAEQLTFSETGELSISGGIKGYLIGTANNIPIGTCSTAAATAAKTVTFQNFVLTTGAHIAVKFTIANTASNPTLNVSETGAKAIQFNNANIPASYLKIGLYEFIYDGTYWNFIGGGGGSDTENGNTTLNNNFNNLINPGRFFVTSTKGTTTNAPMDVTAEWWVDVSVYGSGTNRRILQEARMHTTTTSSATSGPSHILVRCCSNTTWGPWQYSYSQFAG